MEFSTLNGYKVKDKKAIRFYDTVALMKADTTLKNGMHVKTKGYYSANDGGSGEYIIVNDNTLVDDGGSIHTLDNDLKAQLIIINESANIDQFGAKGNGIIDDSQCLINALNVVDTVLFSNKTYYINSSVNIPRDNITLKGLSYRKSKLLFSDNGSINFIGTSILNSGTHKDFFTIDSLNLAHENEEVRENPILNLICCSYVKIINSWVYGKGKQILMWECFDSRILNSDFEWGGSSSSTSSYGIELRSQNGGNSDLSTYEYTNNIYFQGCRFESHIGTCVATTGQHSNKITFESCKFESFNCLNQRALNITHAETVYFTNCVFAGDVGNTKNYVYIDSVTDFTITGYGEHASHNNLSYANEPLFYVSGSGNRKIDIQLNNNNVYTIDQKTFGLDSWDNNIFINGDIHVNNFRNDNLLITSRKTGVATLTNGDTTLDYTCPDNGFIYVSMVGTTGQTTPQKITLKNETSNYELRLFTIGDMYMTGFMPVAKGDNITCSSNTTATAYINLFHNRGYSS